MAEFDDERPDFDAVFRDPPGGEDPRAGRRRASRRREREFDLDDTESTGEVPRPRLGDSDPSPSASDPDGPPIFDDPEPAPRSSRTRSSRPARSRTSDARSRSGGGGGGRPPRSRAGGGGSRRGGSRGPGGGAAVLQQPRARLLLGVAFAVVLVIVIALVVKDCQRSQLEDSYTQYVNGVAQIVTKSAAQGAELRSVMANPRGDKPPVLRTKILAIAKEAQGLVDQADDLNPPGSLSTPQQSLVNGVLAYRVTGLTKLAENLSALLQGSSQQSKASGLAQVMKRFLASDVIYEDSFAGPAAEALKKDDITGVKVPPPAPFLPNAALASPEGAKTLISDLERRTTQNGGTGGSSTTGNLRGMSLESTVAEPSGTRLSVGETVSVQSTELLKWQVTVKNGGDFDESNVIVQAEFSYPATPNDVEKRQVSIPTIASGESTTVELPGPSSEVVTFGEQATLKISVEPVTGETRIDNNSAEYPVKITI